MLDGVQENAIHYNSIRIVTGYNSHVPRDSMVTRHACI